MGSIPSQRFMNNTISREKANGNISRYWTEIVVTGFLPLFALIGLNYGIYTKIRKSAKFRRLHENAVTFRRTAKVVQRTRFGHGAKNNKSISVLDDETQKSFTTSAPTTTTSTSASALLSTSTTATRIRMASVATCSGSVERNPVFCTSSTPIEKSRPKCPRHQLSLNVDSHSAAPIPASHHTTYVRHPGTSR